MIALFVALPVRLRLGVVLIVRNSVYRDILQARIEASRTVIERMRHEETSAKLGETVVNPAAPGAVPVIAACSGQRRPDARHDVRAGGAATVFPFIAATGRKEESTSAG